MKKADLKIKIFSTQRIDKECDCIENEVITPIRCGAVFDDRDTDMLGDNTGENISKRRMSYCELTTQYWAWKNVKADYYGFCHYRRYFSFNKKKFQTDDWGSVIKTYLDEETIEQLSSNPERIQEVVKQYDVLATCPTDLNRVHIASVYEQYKTGPQLHIEDVKLLLSIIKGKYPQYYSAAEAYMRGQSVFFCNMFIMRRDLFDEYSRFLFGLLAEFESHADMSSYSEEGYRTPGHLGERIFGIFYTYLAMQKTYRLGTLQMVTISVPEKEKKLFPAFQANSVNLVFSSSEYFAPYCAAAIQSVLAHRDKKRKYDIIILEQEFSDITKKRLSAMSLQEKGVSIRTLNVRRSFSKYQFHMNEHFSVETYFRLVIPEMLSSYKKILYLDGDLIANADISPLFDTDLHGYVAAAVIDVVGAGLVNGFDASRRVYSKKKLRMQDCLKQLNGGVLLLNIDEIQRQYTSEELLRYAEYGQFILHDQDVFNSLFEGQIKWVDYAWNAAIDPKDSFRAYVATFAPKELFAEYKNAALNPKIIHFAGTIKPWNDPGCPMAEEFWNVLRDTPFYEYVLHRRMIEFAQYFSSSAANDMRSAGMPASKPPKQGFVRSIADKLLPKGSQRRENLKKCLFRLIGKPYVTPYYMLGR